MNNFTLNDDMPKRVYRGEIYFINKGYENIGCEMNGDRPAVIVSNDIGNEHANIVEVVYLTTAEKKAMPTHVPVICRTMSTALCENIDTVSKSRLGDFIRCCTVDEMNKIDEALMISLGIPSKKRLQEVAEVDTAKDAEIRELKKLLEKAEVSVIATPPDTTAAVERDLYKRLYEQLLDKITSGKVAAI